MGDMGDQEERRGGEEEEEEGGRMKKEKGKKRTSEESGRRRERERKTKRNERMNECGRTDWQPCLMASLSQTTKKILFCHSPLLAVLCSHKKKWFRPLDIVSRVSHRCHWATDHENLVQLLLSYPYPTPRACCSMRHFSFYYP